MTNNWRTVPLSEITDINPRPGKKLADDELIAFVPMAAVGASSGAIDVTSKRPYAEVKKGFTPFQSGDVLFAKITVMLGKMLDKRKHQTGSKMLYLRNVNVRWGRIDTDDLLEMYFENSEFERYGLKEGDVLVCEGGEPGRAAVWKGIDSEMK